jgi:hypothetical protein
MTTEIKPKEENIEHTLNEPNEDRCIEKNKHADLKLRKDTYNI